VSGPGLHLVVPGPLEQRTGGYIYDAQMAAGLRRLGWLVTVHNLDGAFPEADERARSSLIRTLADLPDDARVVIDGLAMGALPGPVHAQKDRLRILALVHHPLADETGLDSRQQYHLAALEREALAACRGVLVTSDFTISRLQAFGVDSDRVRAVRPGTDPAAPAAGPGPGAPPMLLCVATVIPRKGQDLLVRALTRLRDLPWRCVCAGSLTRTPAYADGVRTQVREGKLEARIDLVGECDPEALNRFYGQSSLFVLPSHYEGYGMVFGEALARGLPVVSTTGGAIPHTVPAEAGLLVPPADERALAQALDGLLRGTDGETARAKLASAAQRHAALLPSWAQSATAFAEATLDLSPDA
jgi:glycosyltransferase involved in cell wall biosynthesis